MLLFFFPLRNGGTKFQKESSPEVEGPPTFLPFQNLDRLESNIAAASERAKK